MVILGKFGKGFVININFIVKTSDFFSSNFHTFKIILKKTLNKEVEIANCSYIC